MSSKNEIRLAEYVELNELIKLKTKRLNVLKDEIKQIGTHSTQNYTAIVEQIRRMGIDSDAVKEMLGENTPMKSSDYEAIKVSAKSS